MVPSNHVAPVDGAREKLLSHLRDLDRYQLEEFKLGLQCPELLPKSAQKMPWADLKAASPADLLALLNEYFPGGQLWDVTLQIFENMGLTSLCEELTAEGSDPRRACRERLKARILAMWDNMPWPEGHIYLRHVTEQEHEDLTRLLCPGRTGVQPRTIVLHGAAGVGKTTLARKVVMHWVEGSLFRDSFSYVFYISCHQLRDMEDTTFAGLLSQDWPTSQAPVRYFMSHPERLLFVIDGFEEMNMPSNGDDNGPPCPDWYQQLPVARILLCLLKKDLVPAATLLITTRDDSSEDLRKVLRNPRWIRILGFTEADREEYFFRYFGDRHKASDISWWVRENEVLCHSCAAPLVCWTVCTFLKRQRTRRPTFQLSAQTATGLYACFFSNLLEVAEASWSKPSWPQQWRALCALAASGMWSSRSTFSREDVERWHLQAPLIDGLLQLNVLQKVSDCEDCITFTHQSFQAFLGAMFYVVGGQEGAIGSLSKCQEMRVLLNDAFVDANVYWHQMTLFSFGLMNRHLAREVEATLHCEMSPDIIDALLKWAEELPTSGILSCSFEFLPFFRCLYETQEETLVKQMLSHLPEVDLDLGDLQLQVRQWEDICSVFHNGHLSKLDLSNSKLSATFMKKLCYELRNPRCKLQKLTCRSMTPVGVLRELVQVLHGNRRLTHLNLSSNSLGAAVSTMIFRTLRHSACHLNYLCLGDNDLSGMEVTNRQKPCDMSRCALKELSLEKCNLSAASSEGLAVTLTGTRRLSRLCLGFNQLLDDGIQWLCASLRQLDCALERLVPLILELLSPDTEQAPKLGVAGGKTDKLPTWLVLHAYQVLSRALYTRRAHGDVIAPVTRPHNVPLGAAELKAEGVTPPAGSEWSVTARLPPSRVQLTPEPNVHPQRAQGHRKLCGCQLSAPSCRDLSDALLQNESLTHLDLRKNTLGDEGVRLLCQALSRPDCRLQSLDVSDCSVTAKGCRELADALRHNHSMKVLDIGRNQVGDAGGRRLCEAVRRSCCALNTLGLERCGLTSACCRHLTLVLGSRESLVNLNLIGNDLGPEGVNALWESLEKPACKLQKLGLEKDLYDIVKEKLKALQEKGCFLRILCKWDFNDLEDTWWW
ncbi:NACHT, LRR and PYD domains-containing protein 13 [Saccopteryx bilineata]|uniref:NACHT, LRR and PYD domains-containing protein 13 n=1 Tax=Saccopteryx bilineata TaxID=59482 RepID=UPI00338E8D93